MNGVIFNICNICDTNEASIFNCVDPEGKSHEPLVQRDLRRGNVYGTLHVVVPVHETDSKAGCTVQRYAHAPNVSLWCDSCDSTDGWNSVTHITDGFVDGVELKDDGRKEAEDERTEREGHRNAAELHEIDPK